MIDLESRLAHHERMVEEISQMIFKQGRIIDRQSAQIRRLIERLLAVEAGASGPAGRQAPASL